MPSRLESPWRPSRIYAVVDNLNTHSAPDVPLFSLLHPRWEFVFQPEYAAYPILIEPWRKILRSLALKGRRFETWAEIVQAVDRATAYWNQHKHPFIWGRRRRHRTPRELSVATVPVLSPISGCTVRGGDDDITPPSRLDKMPRHATRRRPFHFRFASAMIRPTKPLAQKDKSMRLSRIVGCLMAFPVAVILAACQTHVGPNGMNVSGLPQAGSASSSPSALDAQANTAVASVGVPHLSNTQIRHIAARFDRAFKRGGMSGVIGEVDGCYQKAHTRGATLECVAMDGAGLQLQSAFDQKMNRKGAKLPPLPYYTDAAFGDRMKTWMRPIVPDFAAAKAFVDQAGGQVLAKAAG